MNSSTRSLVDITFGHQYGMNGIESVLHERDVRSFTIMRHPLHRKVSFYFHFFVREIQRREQDVSLNEIRQFILNEQVPQGASVGMDVGPNYYAGHLLSNGKMGFVTNQGNHTWYNVSEGQKQNVVQDVRAILDRYVFIGLQSQPAATLCMLRRVLREFDGVNAVIPPSAKALRTHIDVENKGSYKLGADEVWDALSLVEKQRFQRHEWVDLRIYEHAHMLFTRQVLQFGCTQYIR